MNCHLRANSSSSIRKKAVWGNAVILTFAFAVFSALAAPADAQGRGSKASNSKAGTAHTKLDRVLNSLAGTNGETDVIVEFFDDSDTASRIRINGGVAGRKLGLLKARAGRMPNSMLHRLADD